jgi:hypothetical protein
MTIIYLGMVSHRVRNERGTCRADVLETMRSVGTLCIRRAGGIKPADVTYRRKHEINNRCDGVTQRIIIKSETERKKRPRVDMSGRSGD